MSAFPYDANGLVIIPRPKMNVRVVVRTDTTTHRTTRLGSVNGMMKKLPSAIAPTPNIGHIDIFQNIGNLDNKSFNSFFIRPPVYGVKSEKFFPHSQLKLLASYKFSKRTLFNSLSNMSFK